jgi:hypothetical protein
MKNLIYCINNKGVPFVVAYDVLITFGKITKSKKSEVPLILVFKNILNKLISTASLTPLSLVQQIKHNAQCSIFNTVNKVLHIEKN